MLLKLLGIMDLVAGISAVLVGLDVVGFRAGLAVLLYFTLKIFTFGLEFLSILDVLAGLAILIGAIVNIGITFWIVVFYVLGKGFYSLR